MRITDYFRLSMRYLRAHLDRFIITLVTLTLLITMLMVFASAYSSGANSFEQGIINNYQEHGATYSPVDNITKSERQELEKFLTANYDNNYSLEQAIRLPVNKTFFGENEYPYALQYYAVTTLDNALIVEGEPFDIAAQDNKIWIPAIDKSFGLSLGVGDTLNIRIKIKDTFLDISSTIAGFCDKNSRAVYIGVNYAFDLGIPVSAPTITLSPQLLSYKQIVDNKDFLRRSVDNILDNNTTSVGYYDDSRYYEEYRASVNKNIVLVVLVAVIIAVFGAITLSNSLMLSMMDNANSISLLKSLGLKNRSLFSILCLEGVYIIAIACLVAVALTYALHALIVSICDWLWGSALMMFGAYAINATIPIWLIFPIMLGLVALALIAVYLGFIRSSKKYIGRNMAENNI